MNQSNKILVIAPSWVGDTVMSQGLLRLLKNQDPNCTIDVFAKKYLHPLLARMLEVDNCLTDPFQHGELNLRKRVTIAKQLRKNHYTHAYILPNSFKSAIIPFMAKIPTRTGWLGEQRFFLLNDIRFYQKKFPLMVDQYITLGYKKDNTDTSDIWWPKLQINHNKLQAVLERLQINHPTKPILAIFPGSAYGEAKRWPATYFAKIAQTKSDEGWEVWIFGGKQDCLTACKIQNHCNNICLDLSDKTDLGEATDLISLASAVVTNDTGLMHIAAALDRPTVAVYGSSSMQHTPPLLKNKLRKLSLNLPCSPCLKSTCPLKHNKCMVDLKPDLALKALREIAT